MLGTVFMLMVVVSGCATSAEPTTSEPAANRAPVISQLIADIQVNIGGKTGITCIAVDPDDDIVTYTWTADNGTISGDSNEITWIAPDTAGVYAVTVIVSDDKGLKTEQTINIMVTPTAVSAPVQPNQPPIIKEYLLLRKGIPTVTVTPETEKVRVKRFSSAEFECIAIDPEGGPLKYIWGATEGKLAGQGSKVTYTATTPDENIAITVTVIDDKNARATATFYIEVPCCGSQ